MPISWVPYMSNTSQPHKLSIWLRKALSMSGPRPQPRNLVLRSRTSKFSSSRATLASWVAYSGRTYQTLVPHSCAISICRRDEVTAPVPVVSGSAPR